MATIIEQLQARQVSLRAELAVEQKSEEAFTSAEKQRNPRKFELWNKNHQRRMKYFEAQLSIVADSITDELESGD